MGEVAVRLIVQKTYRYSISLDRSSQTGSATTFTRCVYSNGGHLNEMNAPSAYGLTLAKAQHTFSTNFNNCDLAVPGSPRRSTLMSPRRRIPSGRILRDPPNKRQVIAFLISVYTGNLELSWRSLQVETAGIEKAHQECRRYSGQHFGQISHRNLRF